MRVHHLNCMTFTLAGVPNVTHCLLVETDEGLVLVDTGLGLADYAQPTRHVRVFTAINRIPCDPAETAVRQVARLGYDPADVQDIVLTHLHLDHAGGLPDFPWANVHVYAPEYEAAMRPKRFSFLERFGYEPTRWAHGPRWANHSLAGAQWFGLDGVRVLQSGPAEVWLIPLVAHSPGHCGVAVQTSQGWLLHCGDAYLRQMQVDPVQPRSLFPWWFRPVERHFEKPVLRLRALAREHGDEVRLFCAHDRQTFNEMQSTAND